ncbi:MAG TPA: Gfo/Idh/MocA family oxidoreductase [Armatimonadota bacterium]|jgi:predicted dehydrogenase
MSADPVRLGYVGCGFVAQTIHIPNFAGLPGCELLGLAEVREDLRRSVGARFGIPRLYAGHLELAADPDIEAVAVSAPYALQGRIAADLLRAGKHVFMEKPMAVSVARGEAILAAARESAARLMVGYMKRYDPGNVMIREHLQAWQASGECGRILLARNHGFGGNWVYAQDPNVAFDQSPAHAPPADFPEDWPVWLPEERRDSYVSYLQQWTHNLNLLRFLLGDEAGQAQVKSVLLDDDGMTGLTVLDINGARGVVESGYTRFHAWEEHTTVYFEGGWLRTAAPALMHKETSATVEIYRAAHDEQPARETREFPPPAWAYREEARHFLTQLRTGEPFRSSGEDTLNDVRLCEEIYRQFLRL